MKRRLSLLIAGLCTLSMALRAQTSADSATIVSTRWETTVAQDGIIHKRALIPSLYKGPQHTQPWEDLVSSRSCCDVCVHIGCGGHMTVACLPLLIT